MAPKASCHGMFVTLPQFQNTEINRAGTSQVSSRRERRKTSKAAKKNENVQVEAGSSSRMQQPHQTVVESNNGKTRRVNDRMEYRSNKGWISAVYHNDIRAALLEESSQGIYDFPRKQGKGVNDITSFHPDYKTYGPDRAHRHPILFRYEQKGYQVPSYDPGPWIYQGQIVLDHFDDPVVPWREIPLVLSSAYEGFDMEVVRRLNPSISYRDFRARMPRSIIKGSTRKESWGLSTLSMRNTRFRLAACCLAWDERQGSDKLKEYLDGLLPPECHSNNSTRSFRDLTAYEVEQAKASNKGNYLSRAGGRALEEATRQERDEAEKQRSVRLLAQHNQILEATSAPISKKRKREESSSDSEDEEERNPPSQDPERAANLDQRLFDMGGLKKARTADTSIASVPAPAPALESPANGTRGVDRMVRPLPLQRGSESPAPSHCSINQECELWDGSDTPAMEEESQAEPGPTPLYQERPFNPSPYFLTLEQWRRRQAAEY
ncbi:hypothetical protein MMC07_006624 [Pseudocyphellaria aurata]|nr:hypothetical protein [Pseudocyphellaria aurata]